MNEIDNDHYESSDISDDDNELEQIENEIILGFVEPIDKPLSLTDLPSKIGGKPIWLHPNIPKVEELTCPTCSKILKFLLQIYAPLSKFEQSYHRMLYVFICENGKCIKSNSGVLVYRSQLGANNPYIVNDEETNNNNNEDTNKKNNNDVENMMESNDETKHETSNNSFKPENEEIKLCAVCGIRGPKLCGKCKLIWYCSKEHQIIHWKNGHSKLCKDNKDKNSNKEVVNSDVLKEHLFEEQEIVTENEYDLIEEKKEEQADMNEKLMENLKLDDNNDMNPEDLNIEEWQKKAHFEKDRVFDEFMKRTSIDSSQIIRYNTPNKHQIPLWLHSKNQCNLESIPKCDKCQSPRYFEFQILSQLLYFLHIESKETMIDHDSIDWGTIAIYTCSNSCEDNCYIQEYAYVQPPMSKTA